MNYFISVRKEEIQSFEAGIYLLKSALIALVVILCVSTFGFALVMPNLRFGQFKKKECKIVELLTKLPKKEVLTRITVLEEEIELLGMDEDTEKGVNAIMFNSSSKRSMLVLPVKYFVAVLVFLGLLVVNCITVVNMVDETVLVPEIYDV
jgi:hypothetical protein